MTNNTTSPASPRYQIMPSDMPFSPSFIADNVFKFPLTIALIGLYVYLVAMKKFHQFRNFTHFHVIMYTNIFFLIIWQILPLFWSVLEGIAIFFWIAFLAIFYLGMVNQILLNFVLCQTALLFFSDIDNPNQRSKWDVGREKLIFIGSMLLLFVEIILEVAWRFYRTIFGRLVEIDIPIILSHIAIIGLLIGWFSWWIKAGRRARLSPQQLCHIVQSVIFISASTLLLLISVLFEISSRDPTETVHFTLPMGTLLILPFLWPVSAMLCDLPSVPRFFYPVEAPVVEFNMS